jgi:hypothetical protein
VASRLAPVLLVVESIRQFTLRHRFHLCLMQQSSGPFEKIILGVAVAGALGTAAMLYLSTQSFGEGLGVANIAPKSNLNPPDTKAITDAIGTISKRYTWASPVINDKPVPLNKSVLLVKKVGTVPSAYDEQVLDW